jgi:hypothetical protein
LGALVIASSAKHRIEGQKLILVVLNGFGRRLTNEKCGTSLAIVASQIGALELVFSRIGDRATEPTVHRSILHAKRATSALLVGTST